jgi:hypothetical protein
MQVILSCSSTRRFICRRSLVLIVVDDLQLILILQELAIKLICSVVTKSEFEKLEL